MDKGIHIHVCLLVFHGLGIVLGCTMMSLYILLGLFRNHIHVIGLHGCIKNLAIRHDYSKTDEIARGYIAVSSSFKVIYILCAIAIYMEFILAMVFMVHD
jgi:hypothetical protein